jgi:hypothetical protein
LIAKYKNYKDQIRSLQNQETGLFCNDCSSSLYSATALPLKAETFRPLAANADVFFIEGVGYGAFRRPAVTTTEAAAGSIKAEQRRPREKESKRNRNRGRTRGELEQNPEKKNPENRERQSTN